MPRAANLRILGVSLAAGVLLALGGLAVRPASPRRPPAGTPATDAATDVAGADASLDELRAPAPLASAAGAERGASSMVPFLATRGTARRSEDVATVDVATRGADDDLAAGRVDSAVPEPETMAPDPCIAAAGEPSPTGSPSDADGRRAAAITAALGRWYDLGAFFASATTAPGAREAASADVARALANALAPFATTPDAVDVTWFSPTWLRVRAPEPARATIEATLDRVASIGGPCACLRVDVFAGTSADAPREATLTLDAPREREARAAVGPARIRCETLDLEVGQEWFGYEPIFDIVHDGLDVGVRWDASGDVARLDVTLTETRSIDRAQGAAGTAADFPVAQDVAFPPTALTDLLTVRETVTSRVRVALPAEAGCAVDAALGDRAIRVAVCSVDEGPPLRRGWSPCEAVLADASFYPVDVETLDVVVDRPHASGGRVEAAIEVVERTSPILPIDPSRIVEAALDVPLPLGPGPSSAAWSAARTLTTRLALSATAGPCVDGPRTFDVVLRAAGDDLRWGAVDVPAPWGSDTLTAGREPTTYGVRLPEVMALEVPLRITLAAGVPQARELWLDRGAGLERWTLTIGRRAR